LLGSPLDRCCHVLLAARTPRDRRPSGLLRGRLRRVQLVDGGLQAALGCISRGRPVARPKHRPPLNTASSRLQRRWNAIESPNDANTLFNRVRRAPAAFTYTGSTNKNHHRRQRQQVPNATDDPPCRRSDNACAARERLEVVPTVQTPLICVSRGSCRIVNFPIVLPGIAVDTNERAMLLRLRVQRRRQANDGTSHQQLQRQVVGGIGTLCPSSDRWAPSRSTAPE